MTEVHSPTDDEARRLANADEVLNSEGDTLRSLIDEIADAPAHNVLGMEVVSLSLSKANRDHLVNFLRNTLSSHIPGEEALLEECVRAMERFEHIILDGEGPVCLDCGYGDGEGHAERCGYSTALATARAALEGKE